MNKLYFKARWMKNKAVEALKDESGMGVIEIAIIIIVLIAIAIAFRSKIITLVESLFAGMGVEDAIAPIDINTGY